MEEKDINLQDSQNENSNSGVINPVAQLPVDSNVNVPPTQAVDNNFVPRSKKYHLLPILAFVFGILSNTFESNLVRRLGAFPTKMLMVASGVAGLLGMIFAIIALAKKQNKIISHICFFICMIPILYIIMYLYLMY